MQFIRLVALLALATTCGARAQTTPASGADPAARPAPAAAVAPPGEGEVRKVDKELGKLTLRHGPLPNLDMPAMTMVFRVADPKLLEGLKEGDRIRFTAEKVNGVYTVTGLKAVD